MCLMELNMARNSLSGWVGPLMGRRSRIELAQRASSGIARIHVKWLADGQPLLVKDLKTIQRKESLAANDQVAL